MPKRTNEIWLNKSKMLSSFKKSKKTKNLVWNVTRSWKNTAEL